LRPWWLPLWLWQRRWWIALATLFILVWWLVPPLLYRHTGTAKDAKLKAITDTRTALLAGLIGLGALLTFWLNSRMYRITARTFEVTEQGHITERYTKAIEQLGSDKLDVRLGGIYALERIAVDSKRDHPTVVEVLGAFIREHSQLTTQPSLPATDGASGEPTMASPRPGPTTDVQAACTILGRLPLRPGVPRGDLSGAHLKRANLSGAHLEGANLTGAHLGERADLSGAHMEGANLTGAHLEGTNLRGTHLEGADLVFTHLEGTDLRAALGLSPAQVDHAIVDVKTKLPWERWPPRRVPAPPPSS
jgi:hypothetical protein